MSKIIYSLLIVLIGCSSIKAPEKPAPLKEFSKGEIILAGQLLMKVFDQEMAPLSCVADIDEASLLLRTIRPRMELVQDDMEALLDDPKEIDKLINTCEQNCTCIFVDDLLREHQVPLNKKQNKTLAIKLNEKEQNRCLSFVQKTFCDSELYKELNKEKGDFSFEEE